MAMDACTNSQSAAQALLQPSTGLCEVPPPAAESPHVVRASCFRSCLEVHCAPASSGCGCVRRRHSVQSVLPGARATDFEQPFCWQRLPPPCGIQCCVPTEAAALGQPTCWQRLPPPCGTQCCVSPRADLRQPSSWHRLPPPCVTQCPVSPRADLVQSSSWQRLPPPCGIQCCVPTAAAALGQSTCWQRLPPPCGTQCCVSPRADLRQPS
jgi:hypothetical protein